MANNAETPILTNSGDRDERRTTAFKKRLTLEREIEKLKEEHLVPIQQEMREDWSALATQLGMTKKDLKLAYSLFKRWQDTFTFEDEEEAAEVRDHLRELFNQLNIGESLDLFVHVAEATGADKGASEKPKGSAEASKPEISAEKIALIAESDEMADARGMGIAHAGNDRNSTKSPYEPDTDEDLAYHWGYWWETGRLERELAMPLESNPHKAGTIWWSAYDDGWHNSEASANDVDDAGETELEAEDDDGQTDPDDKASEEMTAGAAGDDEAEADPGDESPAEGDVEPDGADDTEDDPIAADAIGQADNVVAFSSVTDPTIEDEKQLEAIVNGAEFKSHRLDGMQAYLDGKGHGTCPFQARTPERNAWSFGWYTSEADEAFGAGKTLEDCPSSRGTLARFAWEQAYTAQSVDADGVLTGAEGEDIAGDAKSSKKKAAK